ncbi:MAG: hypothetical protein JSS14_23070 [Proteobacteria bacterium]|nr:hypothetical protein [Pseudomonadota bacterium]
MFKNQNASVAQAKKAIADYKKAIGQADGLAELMVFYREQASGDLDPANWVGPHTRRREMKYRSWRRKQVIS